MPHWYWEKKELRTTPSQADALDFECEMRYRREGVRFIIELGKALNLSHTTMASGAVYFHRFYMFHSFHAFPKYVVATCCLFLAGKAEETPKKCRDIIRTVRSLTNDRQFATFGADPKEEVMVLERILLQTIKFDLQVDHPYSSLIKYAKCLKGDKAKLQKMVQMSWTFVNDSLCTTLCLQWEAEIVAIALMYLAAKLSKFEVKDWNDRKEWHKHWWDQYVENLDVDVLEDICHQVLDLYAQPHTPAKEQAESPPPGSRPPPSAAALTPSAKPAHSAQPPSRRTTPPSPRDAQPPPPPKSRPHTPPQPPMPPAGPPPMLPAAAIGAPTVFQQQQASLYVAAATPSAVLLPPPLPVAASPSFHQLPPPQYPPAYHPQQQQPAATPPVQRYHQPGGGYGYPALANPPPPPSSSSSAGAANQPYYSQPPPPPPAASDPGYYRGGHSRF